MSALVALAVQAGLPMIEKVLTEKFGASGGGLATDVVRAVAKRAGVAPEGLDQVVEDQPGRVIDAMKEVERMMPELIPLYVKGLDFQLAALQAEEGEPLWARAWRPAGMYLLGFIWLWNIVILHVANAVWKIALPATPFDVLIQISGLYMGLYMGGHTIKDVAAKWKGAA